MSKSWSHRADLFRTSFSLVECDLFQSRGRARRFLNWQERPSPNSNYTEYSCRLFADSHFLTGWDVAFLRSAYHIPLTRCTCSLWRFADMRRHGQNAEIAILAIRIRFAFIRSKRR